MDYTLKALQRIGAPPMFSRPVMEMLADRPALPADAIIPSADFTRAKKNKLPQAIAHRGSKISFPENTMVAFKGAVADGVDALETDVHITKDGVVVISHDPTLQRCFGVDKKIADCDWKELSEARTLREPHVGMPRLDEFLEYLSQPETAHIWVLLDIKLSNNPDQIMRLIAEALAKTPSAPGTKWHDRIILGCWAARFIPHAHTHLPLYPITHIGFSIPYSRQFLSTPHISFNLLLAALWSPSGRRMIADAKAANRPVYAWTANEDKAFDWCIRQGLDGVITDDPRKFIAYRKAFQVGNEVPRWELGTLLNYLKINLFAILFGIIFWVRYGFGLKREVASKK